MSVSQAREHHDRVDPHPRTSWLGRVVLGGQDGVVNVLGLALGVAFATDDPRVVIVAGLAGAFAESLSMAAVGYTTSMTEGDRYRAERAREYRHIASVPEIEREEVRAIYAKKGFSGELLDRIVATITSDKEVWVAVMMTEEHALAARSRRESAWDSVVIGASSLVGSLLPIAPFFVMPVRAALVVSLLLSTATLFALGWYKGRVTVGSPARQGTVLAAIGVASAIVGFAIGAALRVTPAP